MSSLNYKQARPTIQNHQGAVVPKINAKQQLVRMTLANMLWENQFYVDGKTSAEIIVNLVKNIDADFVSALAIGARSKFKLRHIPLLLTRELAKTSRLKADVLANVIQRPDEMGEFLSLYWKENKDAPLAAQVKKGLAQAFGKFNEYQLAKWDKNSAGVSIRDVMFLTHPKPANPEQEALFKRIADQKMQTPDTWETELSGGSDKAQTFTRLMAQKKLGALAFLRNLRNMVQAGISETVIRAYATSLDVTKVLPFRYIAAARIVPQFEDMLEDMMLRSLSTHAKISGKTVLLVDISGSMFGDKVSAKSDLERFDAAAALAILLREVCESVEIYSFSNSAVRVAPRRGFALVEAIRNSQSHSGTALHKALTEVPQNADRYIVFTDEQANASISKPAKGSKGYIVNVAAYQNGVNHSDWTTITGFSESVVDYIQALEGSTELFQ